MGSIDLKKNWRPFGQDRPADSLCNQRRQASLPYLYQACRSANPKADGQPHEVRTGQQVPRTVVQGHQTRVSRRT